MLTDLLTHFAVFVTKVKCTLQELMHEGLVSNLVNSVATALVERDFILLDVRTVNTERSTRSSENISDIVSRTSVTSHLVSPCYIFTIDKKVPEVNQKVTPGTI
jgi:hypothetical protein